MGAARLSYRSTVFSCSGFFVTDTATTEIYTLSLHDALPILRTPCRNASFHRITKLPPGETPRALKASLGNASDVAPATAATRKRRRESRCSRTSKPELLGQGEGERRDGEVNLGRDRPATAALSATAALGTVRAPSRGTSRTSRFILPPFAGFCRREIYATCADLANLRRKAERGYVALQKRRGVSRRRQRESSTRSRPRSLWARAPCRDGESTCPPGCSKDPCRAG